MVAWLVKAQAGWRCEHCGAYRPPGAGDNLTVHHLDGNSGNLQSWNLVPLCFPCHGLVARLVRDLDIEQLGLLGEPLFPWLAERLRERALHPWRPPPAAPVGRVVPEPTAVACDSARACVCGCGRRVPPATPGRTRIYASRACQQRAYRERRQPGCQSTLSELIGKNVAADGVQQQEESEL